MDGLIQIHYEYEAEQPTVSARELHTGLNIETDFRHWFRRVAELGFRENLDYRVSVQNCTEKIRGRPEVDYEITLDMAKHICMLQRTEQGMKYRQYFLELEKAWNRPELVMARALQLANKVVEQLREQNQSLGLKMADQAQLIRELQPKARYVDYVLQSPTLVLTTQIAKDYGMSAVAFNRMLHDMDIQYKAGTQWVLYARYQDKGYAHSRTFMIPLRNGGTCTKMQTEWTQKGRLFLYQQLKSQGILPLIEKEGGDSHAGGNDRENHLPVHQGDKGDGDGLKSRTPPDGFPNGKAEAEICTEEAGRENIGRPGG